jgi:hypothetical protein
MDRLLREGNPPTGQLASPKPQYKDVQTNNWEELKGEGGASYVKDKDVFAKLEQARALLDAISGKDFATQTTLAAVLAKLADLESELATIKANQLSGDQKVQLSGTTATELIKEFPSTDLSGLTGTGRRFGANGPSSLAVLQPLDVRGYNEILVFVRSHNTATMEFTVALEAYNKLSGGINTSANRILLGDGQSLPAGASYSFTLQNSPILQARCLFGLGVFVGWSSTPQEGDIITIQIFGRRAV